MNKTTKDLLELASWFLGTVLFQSLFIPFGIELCDIGFFLTIQRGIHVYKELPDLGFMTFLSDWVGGWWMGLGSGPSWVWARLGGAVCGGAIAGITFWTFKDRFQRRALRLVLVLPAVLIGGHIINYYSFPAVLLSLMFCLTYRLVGAEGHHISNICAFLVGVLLWLSVLARFPLVVLPAGCVVLLAMSFLTRQIPDTIKSSLILVMAGFLTAVAITIPVLMWGGFYDPIVSELKAFFIPPPGIRVDDSHNIGQLAMSYVSRSIKATIGASFWLGVLYAVGGIKNKRHGWVTWPIIIGLGFFMVFLKVKTPYSGIPRFREMFVWVLAATCVYFAWIQRKSEPRKAVMSLLSVVFMFSLPIGSNMGLWTAFCGSAPCLCLAFLAWDELGRTSNSPIVRRIGSVGREFATSVVIVFLSFPNGSGLIYGVPNVMLHPGVESKTKMTGFYKTLGLGGMRGEPFFVKEVDEVVAEMRKSVRKDETAFVLDCIGGFNFLSETRPFLRSTLLNSESTNTALALYAQSLQSRGTVKVMVWFKQMEKNPIAVVLRNKAVGDYNLSKTYDGKLFEVYSRGGGKVDP